MTWYCIRTATRQEKRAEIALRELGAHVYLPCETRQVRHARREEPKTYPLFAGYLFAQLSPDQIYAAATADCVHKIMGLGRSQETVSPSFIAWLAFHEHMGAFNRVPWSPAPTFAVGKLVKVATGKYTGFLGEIIQMRGNNRALLLVSQFGKAQKIERPLVELEAA